MYTYRITLDEIAANLFIEISRRNPELDLRSVFVSYKELERYAENMASMLDRLLTLIETIQHRYFTNIQDSLLNPSSS